jgi:hypothetical protein
LKLLWRFYDYLFKKRDMERIGLLLLVFSFFILLQIKGHNHKRNAAANKLDNSPDINGRLKTCALLENQFLGEFNTAYLEFEDLQQCNIKVKSKKLKTTMAARPTFFSSFRKKANRKYIILINNDTSFDGVLAQDVPKDARIGLFAHELMHIRDYQEQNFWGLLKRGVQYLSKAGKKQLEHHVDSLTIDAGFGYYLHDWANFVMFQSSASDEYKAFKQEIYMTPKLILQHINCQE